MPSAKPLLCASIAVIALALGAPAALAQTGPEIRPVVLPSLPPGAVCAEEKTALIERASLANGAAAENAQAAARFLAERQAEAARQRGGDTAIIDAARRERDLRLDEWRRAEALFEAAVRLEERDCRPAAERAETQTPQPPQPPPAVQAAPPPAPPPPAVAQPPAQAIPPAGGDRPAVSLAVAVEVPPTCRANEVCRISIEIENRGTQAYQSPLLASVSLGVDGGALAEIAPDLWACARGGEALSCATSGLTLQADTRTRLSIDWRLPERLRRPSASVCARIVWPGRTPGGIYRAEQVAAVQFALERLGFDAGGPTGRIGPRTVEAIRNFRQRAGIPGSAEITPDLLSMLFGSNAQLTGDDAAGNDTACGTIAFQPGAVTPPAAGTPPPPPPVALAPRPETETRVTPPADQAAPPPAVVPPPPAVTAPRQELTPEQRRERAAEAQQRRREAQRRDAQRREAERRRAVAERRAADQRRRQQWQDDDDLPPPARGTRPRWEERRWGGPPPRVVMTPQGPVYVYPGEQIRPRPFWW